MIEAVNSSIANSQVLRGNVAQASVSHAMAQAPPPPQAVEVPQAPFISPHIVVDLNYDKAVLQIRDSDTGDVQQQFPSESRLAQLSQAQVKQEAAQVVRDADLPSVEPRNSRVSDAPSSTYSQTGGHTSDIITVQDVTSSAPANSSASASPQAAVAALSAGAQSGQSSSSAGVSVLA